MMGFERFNRFIKGLCFNKHWPMSSVANAYLRAAAVDYKVSPPTIITTTNNYPSYHIQYTNIIANTCL